MNERIAHDGNADAASAHHATVAISLALALLAIAFRAWVVFRTSAPLGLDGYYYAVQLRSLLASGSLYYPAMPVGFWLLAPFAALTDPIVGTKLGAATLTGIATPAVMLIVLAVTGDRTFAALGGLIAALSPDSLMLTTEFVKQGIGLTLVLWMVAVAASARTRRDTIAVALFGVACLGAHGTSAVMAPWFLAPLVFVRSRGTLRAGSLLAMGVGAGAILWKARGLLVDALTSSQSARDPNIETRIAMVTVVLLAVIGIVRRQKDRSWIPVVAGPATFGIAINLPLIDTAGVLGLGPRLQLMAFVTTAICLPTLLALVSTRRVLAYLAMLIALPVSFVAAREAASLRYEAPKPIASGLRALAGRLPADAILIAQEHSTAFEAKWYLDVETVSHEPDTIDTARTYRFLGAGIPKRIKEELLRFEDTASTDLPRSIRSSGRLGHFTIVIVPEPTWQAFVDSLPPALRATVDPWPERRGS